MQLKYTPHEQQKASFNGVPFFVGVVNILDGQIQKVYRYETCQAAGFHHSNFIDHRYLDNMYDEYNKTGQYCMFWIAGKMNIESWLELPPWLYGKIQDQIQPIKKINQNKEEFNMYNNIQLLVFLIQNVLQFKN